jgi:hypothetical protein
MIPYLTEAEISKYTRSPGLTINEVEQASAIINSYIGRSFGPTEHTEQPKLSKKNSGYGKVHKGKLRHSPRVNILEVTAMVPSYFGGLQKVDYGIDSLWFDDDEFDYFTFMHSATMNTHTSIVNQSIFATPMPSVITVKYTSGYTEIPEEIKRACGMVMDAVKSNGGTVAWKSRSDFDMTVVLRDSEDPIMTNTVIRLLNSVKLS